MTTTSKIEQALKRKVTEEINAEVQLFVDRIEDMARKYHYNYSGYVTLKLKNKNKSDDVIRIDSFPELTRVLLEAIEQELGDRMLQVKVTELIQKVDILN